MTDSISIAVFFSDLLPKKCPILYKNLVDELGKENISYGLLKNTKDIWCRDYMPIQTDSNRFVLYRWRQCGNMRKQSGDDRESIL